MPDDMHQLILDAATRRFARSGVASASLSKIAADVGIQKPSLLYHFRSKAELHEAVIASLVERWRERLPSLLLAATDGESRFEAVVWEVVHFFAEDPDRARILLREMLDRPEWFRGLLVDQLSTWMDVVVAALRRGMTEGTIRDDLEPATAVMLATQLLLSGVATYDVLSAFEPADAPSTLETAASADGVPDGFERYLSQLVRFAHAGLFRDA